MVVCSSGALRDTVAQLGLLYLKYVAISCFGLLILNPLVTLMDLQDM
jgi:hypothetical protein